LYAKDLDLAACLHDEGIMLSSNQSFAYAYFGDEDAAAHGVQKLIDRGFDSEQIGVLMRRESKVEDVPLDHKTGIAPGAAIGSVLGIAVGAAALPATGVIALGGAFATVGGAAVGGAAGTLMGALGGMGFWKETLAVPHAAFEHGGVLVGALTQPERTDEARTALSEAGAQDTKVATRIEAKRDLQAMDTVYAHPAARNIGPDKLARNIFLLCLAYVLAVVGSIWLFIRPV
jgi:hypothetical protein